MISDAEEEIFSRFEKFFPKLTEALKNFDEITSIEEYGSGKKYENLRDTSLWPHGLPRNSSENDFDILEPKHDILSL